VDAALARVAVVRRGLVTDVDLAAAGLGRRAIARRVAAGRLHPVHPGVYLVGHPVLPPLAAELAAVLTCRAPALLSHQSAARLWELPAAGHDAIHVTVVGHDPGRRRGLRIHRVRKLGAHEMRLHDGIPLTSPARTILDLAAALTARETERALAEAYARELVSRSEVEAALVAAGGRRGVRTLRAVLDLERGPSLTRSEAEERLLALVRSAGLPDPETNRRLQGMEVDFLWRAARLIVEVDGYAFHSRRAAFERDRARDARLQAAGFRVIRVTWRQLVDEPHAVVAVIARTLGRYRRPN
jgi:very-short-patch-repair endonuclease